MKKLVVLIVVFVVAGGGLTGLLLSRKLNKPKDLGPATDALLDGDYEKARKIAIEIRGSNPGPELDSLAAEVLGQARGLEKIGEVEPRIADGLRLGETRPLAEIMSAIDRMAKKGKAEIAIRILKLRWLEYLLRDEEKGKRVTIAGAWCLLLAKLADVEQETDSAAQLRNRAAVNSPRLGAWAKIARFVDPVDGAEMILVLGGSFRMGMTEAEVDRLLDTHLKGVDAKGRQLKRNILMTCTPEHTVTLTPYYIARCETSNRQFEQFIRAGGYTNDAYWGADEESVKWRAEAKQRAHVAPHYWKVSEHWNDPDLPVVSVTRYEVDAYCRWAAKQLPTEAQWELAARGPERRLYPWGNEWKPGLCAGAEHWAKTHEPQRFPGPNTFRDYNHWAEWRDRFQTWKPAQGPTYLMKVDSLPEGRSPFGLHHMAGNAAEWVRDWFDPAYYASTDGAGPDPTGPVWSRKNVLVSRVIRGGYFNRYRIDCRADVRSFRYQADYGISNGFRVALDAGPKAP